MVRRRIHHPREQMQTEKQRCGDGQPAQRAMDGGIRTDSAMNDNSPHSASRHPTPIPRRTAGMSGAPAIAGPKR
jgi:hypothetical protein